MNSKPFGGLGRAYRTEKTPLQRAEYDYNIARSNAEWWAKKKDREYEKYKKVLEEAGKCNCNVCPTCGKEK
jgi:hypothetical protein